MIILLDTSSTVCKIWAIDQDDVHHDEWDAGRDLSKGLLSYINGFINKLGGEYSDISGIVVFRGPGSFTGLRIGITVMNTMAYSLGVPIVGVEGDNWREEGLASLRGGGDDKVVVPLYGAEANITTPRK